MKGFPVMAPQGFSCPASIPWRYVEGAQEQAWRNHGQTLERLAERGGLDPRELRAVVFGLHYHEVQMTDEELVQWVRRLALAQE